MTADRSIPARDIYSQGHALHAQGRLADARVLYHQTLLAEPRHFDATYDLGVIALQSNDPAQALGWFSEALQIDPTSAEAHCDRGNALFDLGRYQSAIASYDNAIAFKPGYAEACNSRGSALAAPEHYEAALASFQRATAIAPGFAEAHHNRGTVCKQLGRWDDALAGYDQALALQPDFAAAHSDRADVLRALGQWQEALAACDKALGLRPYFADAHLYRAHVHAELERWPAALSGYERAIAIDGDLASAHFGRGNVQRLLGQFDVSAASFDRTAALDPKLKWLPGLRLHVKMRVCDWNGFDDFVTALIAGIERGEAVTEPLPVLSMAGSGGLQRRAAEIWTRERYPPDLSLRTPGSVLFLYAFSAVAERNLRQEALDRAVDPSRLVFGATLPMAEYLARYRAADLFLETQPYNAGATASDALWAGLPVLTCAGETFAGRVAASLLTAIGLPELITHSPQQYENFAVELAGDAARLAALKERLGQQRLSSRLFDTGRFTRDLEAAYAAICERQQAGLPPEDTGYPSSDP